jgi:PEP-CTERM motif
MRRTLLTTTGLAWLALTGAAGAATVTLKPGPMNPSYFSGESAGDSNFSVGTDKWTLVSGSAAVQVGSKDGVYADPLGMTNPYMAVEGGGTEQVTFAKAQTSISIYWGSIDAAEAGTASAGNTNSFAITVDGFTLTGEDLLALGADGSGSHSDPKGNELVTISGLAAFTTATFSSTHNAFEFSLVPPSIGTTGTVPEPSTWAMMMLGFAGLGYAAFRRNSKGQTAVSAI